MADPSRGEAWLLPSRPIPPRPVGVLGRDAALRNRFASGLPPDQPSDDGLRELSFRRPNSRELTLKPTRRQECLQRSECSLRSGVSSGSSWSSFLSFWFWGSFSIGDKKSSPATSALASGRPPPSTPVAGR